MNQLLTVTEMARKLRVSRWTVRRWAGLGRIPCLRPSPRKLLFDEAAVEAALVRASGPALNSERNCNS